MTGRNYPPRPKTVWLFTTCLSDLFFPGVRRAVIDVLERLGYRVIVPPDQTCCGQPAYNAGHPDQARTVAEGFLEMFRETECVVIPSASCAGMVRVNYPELFRDDPERLKEAAALAGRVFELAEFLVHVHRDPLPFTGSSPAILTYHYSCHQRELGMNDETVRLLRQDPGVTLIPLEGERDCCGFGGVFSARVPEVSGALLDRKLEAIEAAQARGAEAVVVNDLGCVLHQRGGAERRGKKIVYRHLAEELRRRAGEKGAP
jgi:L-lactate dehydrogenase complex protein LldE